MTNRPPDDMDSLGIADRLFRDEWSALLSRVERRDHPDSEELARMVDLALKHAGVSEAGRKYVGERICGETNLGHGGAPAKSRNKVWSHLVNLQTSVNLLEAGFRIERDKSPKRGRIDPRKLAIEIVALTAKAGNKPLEVVTLKRKLARGLRDAPGYVQRMIPSTDDIVEALSEMVANGEVRTDRMVGLVWLSPSNPTREGD